MQQLQCRSVVEIIHSTRLNNILFVLLLPVRLVEQHPTAEVLYFLCLLAHNGNLLSCSIQYTWHLWHVRVEEGAAFCFLCFSPIKGILWGGFSYRFLRTGDVVTDCENSANICMVTYALYEDALRPCLCDLWPLKQDLDTVCVWFMSQLLCDSCPWGSTLWTEGGCVLLLSRTSYSKTWVITTGLKYQVATAWLN